MKAFLTICILALATVQAGLVDWTAAEAEMKNIYVGPKPKELGSWSQFFSSEADNIRAKHARLLSVQPPLEELIISNMYKPESFRPRSANLKTQNLNERVILKYSGDDLGTGTRASEETTFEIDRNSGRVIGRLTK